MTSASDTLALALAAMPGAEPRAGQVDMCEAVAAAFEAGRHLLVEAPTGTGKSLAYAVAAALHARTSDDARVVVTTATKALQEQLCDEDLPFLQKALAAHGIEFSFTLLKGRANYVCAAKLDELATGDDRDAMFEARTANETERASALARVREWAEASPTGDRAELAEDVPDEVWASVSTTSTDCPGAAACPAGERCAADGARARAHEADIVVVNTALYGAHLAAFRQVLPEHDAVVVDEAHLAEDVFADQFGFDVAAGRLRNLAGVAAPFASAESQQRLRDLGTRLDVLWSTLSRGDDPRVRACEGEAALALDAVRVAVAEVARAIRDATPERGSALASRKARADKTATTLARDVGLALDASTYESHVAWCEIDRGTGRLLVMPIDVGELLADRMQPHATVVATSATLTVGGTFDAVAPRLGFASGEWDGVRVPSPFDFRTQAMLYVPRSLPDPRHPAYADASARELHELIVAAGGRTLALFTSWSAMRATAQRCAAAGTYDVLRQGDAPRKTLVDALREHATTGGVAVFATMGFWTGVDVPGLGVTLVTIDRIPFPRPNEPLHAARRDRAVQAGSDPFHAVDVPRAALLLAQGAGRLVRRRDDRGVVAVLDRRLATAGYRRALLDSLPPFKRTVDGNEVRAFLRRLADGGFDLVGHGERGEDGAAEDQHSPGADDGAD